MARRITANTPIPIPITAPLLQPDPEAGGGVDEGSGVTVAGGVLTGVVVGVSDGIAVIVRVKVGD